MGIRDHATDRAAPSDSELAALVEQMLVELFWRVTSELPNDLSQTAASTLRYLLDEGPQRVTRLAAREKVAQPTMSVIIKRLELRQLVARRVDVGDRRATLVEITPLGIETLRERREMRSAWFMQRLGALDADERRDLAAAIERLLDTFA